ncbi:MAG: c-type cytochrome biogenesis protein CcmI [Pseudomonadota bacterium]
MMFWLIAAILCVVASGFIFMPLLRANPRSTPDRESAVVTIFQERLVELRTALKDGTLTQSDFDQLKTELEDSLLSELPELPGSGAGQGSGTHPGDAVGGLRWSIGLSLVLIVIATGLYGDIGLSLGAIEDHRLSVALRETDPADRSRMRANAERLQRQMDRQPDNHQGWFLLASYLLNAEQPEQAAQAFAHLIDAYPADVDLAARYAETLFIADDRRITSRVELAIEQVQSLQPMHTGMMELRGMAAAAGGDYAAALSYFERAASTLSSEERTSQRGRILDAAIVRVREMAGAMYSENEVTSVGREITVDVSLAAHLAVPPDMPLFVYARAAGGPAMPLAVQRLRASDLPMTIALTEAMAMTPAMSLASFDQVEVVARLSASGIANAGPDDYEARSSVVSLEDGRASVQLEIVMRRRDLGL